MQYFDMSINLSVLFIVATFMCAVFVLCSLFYDSLSASSYFAIVTGFDSKMYGADTKLKA